MAKRFTDTKKWEDGWFLELSCDAKVLFCFLCDKCDLAGFYERHDKTASFYTGIPLDRFESLYEELKKSVLILNGVVWVKNFIRHQKNLPLNPRNNSHKQIVALLTYRGRDFGSYYPQSLELSLEEIRGLEGACKPLLRGPGKGKDKGNGKGKDQGQEGIVKGRNPKPTLAEVQSHFAEKGSPAEAQRFWDYYESVGWVVGRSRKPMRNWRGAVSTWLTNCREWGKNGQSGKGNNSVSSEPGKYSGISERA